MPNGNVRVETRDPLRNFQFIVKLDVPGKTSSMTAGYVQVAGVQRVSGLSATVSPVETWEGGNNRHRYANPDKITWEPVTLEQGIALDDTLETWAQAVQYFVMTGQIQSLPSGASGSTAVKRNVTIELWPPSLAAGPKLPERRYHIYNAWISRYNALPRLDALASEVALVTVELIHEGWTVEMLTQPYAGRGPFVPPPQ